MNRKKTILVLLVIASLLASSVGAHEETDRREIVVDSDGILYMVIFNEQNSTIVVNSENPTPRSGEHTGYVITVDGQRTYDADFNLDRNEQRTNEINITPGLHVNQDNHTVEFATYGNSTQFNFTRNLSSSNSGQVPTPYISEVEVTNGTIRGEPSAVANVTVVNPSEQLYGTKLFVHTLGTDGSFYPASVPPGGSDTITVELLDERGAEIAGEARLYTGNLTTEDGAMDQVEFVGQAGEETEVWEVPYEPAKPTWMNDHYQYENESYGMDLDERISRGNEVEGVPVVYPVAGLLAGLVILRKLR